MNAEAYRALDAHISAPTLLDSILGLGADRPLMVDREENLGERYSSPWVNGLEKLV